MLGQLGAAQETGARGTARPSGPGANTSLDSTRPSIPVTSRMLLTNRRQLAAARVLVALLDEHHEVDGPAMSMFVASTGSRSADWMA